MSLVKKLKKMGKGMFISFSLFLSLNTFLIPITYFKNKEMVFNKKTIVFTSGYDDIFPNFLVYNFVDFFMYSPVVLKQNLKENKVIWHSNATKKEIINNLKNPEYQNIIFIGHGSKSVYEASDGKIKTKDLIKIKLPLREGEFIQYTCGSKDGKGLRKILYPKGSTGYDFYGKTIVTPFEIYFKEWNELIKEIFKR